MGTDGYTIQCAKILCLGMVLAGVNGTADTFVDLLVVHFSHLSSDTADAVRADGYMDLTETQTVFREANRSILLWLRFVSIMPRTYEIMQKK